MHFLSRRYCTYVYNVLAIGFIDEQDLPFNFRAVDFIPKMNKVTLNNYIEMTRIRKSSDIIIEVLIHSFLIAVFINRSLGRAHQGN